MGRSRGAASPGDTPHAGVPRVLTLMLGWALSVLTRLCSVSKPSLMLKRLFCSAEMCVMRRLSICGQALSGTSWQQGGALGHLHHRGRTGPKLTVRGGNLRGSRKGWCRWMEMVPWSEGSTCSCHTLLDSGLP